jgi:hypothetical protein
MSMDYSETTDSSLPWLTISVTGKERLTTLPKVVRTFDDYAKVDIAIGDNDPVYWAVVRARQEFGHEWATRFCVGMLAYYHMGVAARAADEEGVHFWDYLHQIFPTAPRGTMRRHFRTEAGLQALADMKTSSLNPSRFFDAIPRTYMGTRRYCQTRFSQFGEMFQLKVVDYMDRCLGLPFTDMNGLADHLPTQPGKAVKLLYPDCNVSWGFKQACKRVEDLKMFAPPMYDRPVGPAEVETVLCDWSTAKKGGNWPGMDLTDKRETLKGYGGKAAEMAKWLPPVVKKGTFKLELE